MRTTMQETYAIASAHSLPTFPENHKCRRVHGHFWEVEFHVSVETGPDGYAFDHADIDVMALRVLGPLDHRYLNDIPGLERGLGEDLLAWIVEHTLPEIPRLATAKLERITLHEWSSGGGTLRRAIHTLTWTPQE